MKLTSREQRKPPQNSDKMAVRKNEFLEHSIIYDLCTTQSLRSHHAASVITAWLASEDPDMQPSRARIAPQKIRHRDDGPQDEPKNPRCVMQQAAVACRPGG